jgi:hypothetical protein
VVAYTARCKATPRSFTIAAEEFLARDRPLVRRYIEGARDVAKLEISRFNESAIDHRQAERFPLQPLFQDRRRAGVPRTCLQPFPFVAELLTDSLAANCPIGRRHPVRPGSPHNELRLMLFQCDRRTSVRHMSGAPSLTNAAIPNRISTDSATRAAGSMSHGETQRSR